MSKRIKRVKIYLIAAVFIIVFLPSFAKYQELLYKNRKLDERITELKAQNGRLELEKVRLETDMGYIEKTARDKLGVVRKGEIVMKSMPEKR